MEQVIAYKAKNGRLFETAEKCLAYENKLAQYPKIKETIINADDSLIGNGNKRCVNIQYHEVRTQEKPSAQIKTDRLYIVGDRYKFTGCDKGHMIHGVYTFENVYDDYGKMDIAFAEYILNGNDLNDYEVHEIVKKFYEFDNYTKLTATVLETNKKWRVEDLRWLSGSRTPFIITIEKLF